MGSSDTLPRGLLDLAEVSCSSALVLWTLVLEVLFPAEEQLRTSHRHPLLMLLVTRRPTAGSRAEFLHWEQPCSFGELGAAPGEPEPGRRRPFR